MSEPKSQDLTRKKYWKIMEIELPEALAQQLQNSGISQQQLSNVLIHLVQLYLRHYQASMAKSKSDQADEAEESVAVTGDEALSPDIAVEVAQLASSHRVTVPPRTNTLLELRGSVPVSGPQDFEAIRQHVIEDHA